MKMIFLKLFIWVLLLGGQHIFGQGQSKVAKKTCAIICGISQYKYPGTYRTLSYADDDAWEFYSYLTSPAGGSVNPNNIFQLVDKNARKDTIWNCVINAMNNADKIDKLYFYFSGHGDAYRSDCAYLLAYDAPQGIGGKEKNHYLSGNGVIDIHNLKVAFNELTKKGVQVIFISDACRGDDLPGGADGQKYFYKEIMAEKSGEIQLTSCSAGQSSVESIEYGQGRGLFSWHLLNGLKGMADEENEGGDGNDYVTLSELYDYVRNKVKRQRKTENGDSVKYLQVPYYCCAEMEETILSKVDKKELARTHDMISGIIPAKTLNPSGQKGGNDLLAQMEKLGLGKEYKIYTDRLNQQKFIGDESAYTQLKVLLLSDKLSKAQRNELKYMLGSILLDQVNSVTSDFLMANDKDSVTDQGYYHNAIRKWKVCMEITDTFSLKPVDAKAQLLFLEAMECWATFNSTRLTIGISKIDSAIFLNPDAAYLINVKGLILRESKKFDEAISYFEQANRLAPNWLYPVFNLASTYRKMFQYDKAEKFYKSSIALDSTYEGSYFGLARIKFNLNQEDSALYYYRKYTRIIPGDPEGWFNFVTHYLYKNWDSCSYYCHKVLFLENTHLEANSYLLVYHLMETNNQDSIDFYTGKFLNLADKDPSIYERLAFAYSYGGGYEKAITYSLKAIKEDSLDVDNWYYLGASYFRLKNYPKAEESLTHALELDPKHPFSPITLASIYDETGRPDEAIKMYKILLEEFPNDIEYNYEYAFHLVQRDINNMAEAKTYFLKCTELDEWSDYSYRAWACMAGNEGNEVSCVYYLEGIYDLTEEFINERVFDPIRKKAAFKRFVKKRFPKRRK